MIKKWCLLASMAATTSMSCAPADKNTEAKKTASVALPNNPNIVFILADDLGYGDLGCYGSPRNLTPSLDKMAKEGMRFTQFYAGSAVCTPTRVSVLTGKYPLRFNVKSHFNDREMYLQPEAKTIPQFLRKSGYISKHVGKWHLGGLNESHILDRANSMPGPIEHGFDHYLAMIEDPLYRRPAMLERRLYKDAGKHLVRDEKIIPKDSAHWTDIKVNESLAFIEEANKKGKPFYLNLWFDAPHAPYEATPEESMSPFRKQAKGDDLLYRAMVKHLDRGVGRVLDKLKELGIEKNTLVIFTSDNGPAYRGSAGPLKGRKRDFHEGGIRVPFIAYWPGIIEKNTTNDNLAHTNDLLPTFAKIAGTDLNGYAPDGINILPELTGKGKTAERGTVFWAINLIKKNGNYYATTDPDPETKYTEIARNGDWKLLALNGEPKELYNLKEDPYERWNLIKSEPEITQKLGDELQKWLTEPRLAIPY
ncbi:arylsulfatase (plasmid) [Fulvitalea axinellae]|uniref:Arylsulfatase n=1 Tax=Fulvitalea axinellae TaxID=1182444 RepID=A0AAU9CX42_9BACT|nr:arylsulfatase [Fulvitalea axinellae]